MLERFYPDERCRSAYDIDYEAWFARGRRALLFDIDNTLVPHGAPADNRAVALFKRLHQMGYRTCLISNNTEPRVKSFAQVVKSEYLYKAGKPSTAGYLRACEKMQTDPAHTLFVGDQIFTDTWGAKRAGIYTILVDPIHPREEIQIILKRRLEWFVLRAYEKERRKRHNNG